MGRTTRQQSNQDIETNDNFDLLKCFLGLTMFHAMTEEIRYFQCTWNIPQDTHTKP